jgi:hypothetical protein
MRKQDNSAQTSNRIRRIFFQNFPTEFGGLTQKKKTLKTKSIVKYSNVNKLKDRKIMHP